MPLAGPRGGDSVPRGVGQVLVAGLRFLSQAVRGRAELGVPPGDFVRALVIGVRPHFFAFPCAACLAGAAAMPGRVSDARVAIAAVAMGLAWGVGQLLNDLVDLEADAVDAPDRPAVRGLLPEGPTVLVAALLGSSVAAALALVHPAGWLLALSAALLMLAYAPAKALPVLGNLTHGALMAWLAVIGAAVSMPSVRWFDLASVGWRSFLCVGALAALYLQGNYEKDRAGDARAGYHTLATLLGVRGSAVLRVLFGAPVYYFGWRHGLLPSSAGLGLWAVSAALASASVARSLAGGDVSSALAGYRFCVHATVVGLIALALPVLGPAGGLALVAFAVLLIELAFSRTENP